MLGSLRAGLWKQWRDHVSVDSLTGIQETGANLDIDSVVSTIFSSKSKGKRDRDQNVVHSLRDRKISKKILERKVDSAVRGERMAEQKLCEAEAEVEARNWEKRNSDIAFHEINQEFESQRFHFSYIKRVDQFSLHGDLELRSRLFQDKLARGCRIAKNLLRRNRQSKTSKTHQKKLRP